MLLPLVVFVILVLFALGIFWILVALGDLMSVIDDLVASSDALKVSVDAAVAALGQPPADDPRIAQVKAQLDADKAALDAAVAPPPAP